MLDLSPETEALIRVRAAIAGKTPDQLIREALGVAARQTTQTEPRPTKRASLADILAIAERSAARPLLDPRAPDEIVGYDEQGLPR